MTYDVHSEDFELTESIQIYAKSVLAELKRGLPDNTEIQIFLKQEGQHVFSCTVRAQAWHRNFAVREVGHDVYALIADATKKVKHRLQKTKSRRRTKQRHLHENASATGDGAVKEEYSYFDA